MYKVISSLYHHVETPCWSVFFWSSPSNGELKKICMTSSQLNTDFVFLPEKLPDILNLVSLLEDLPSTIAKSFRRTFDARELEWQKDQGLSRETNRISHWLEERLKPLQEKLESGNDDSETDYKVLKGQAYCFNRRALIDNCWVEPFFNQQKSDNPFNGVLEEWVSLLNELSEECKRGDFSTLAKAYGLLASIEAYAEAFDLLGSFVTSVVGASNPVTQKSISEFANDWGSIRGQINRRLTYTQQFSRYIAED